MTSSSNISLVDNYPLPVLGRRKHLLTPTVSPGSLGQNSLGCFSVNFCVLSVLRTADCKTEIHNIFISAYCPDSSVLRRCWHGRGVTPGEPTHCLGRVRSVILGGCWWWSSVPENCDSQSQSVPVVSCQMVMLSLPPPTLSPPDGRPPSSGKFYGFLIENKLNWATLHHSSVRRTSRTSWVILKEVNLKRKTSRWSQEPGLLLCSFWATPTLSEDLLCF